MLQLPINFDAPPRFDGSTFDAERDGARLSGLLERVRAYMADGAWHTLAEIREACGGTEASVSARLRDLRKPRFGALTIERENVGGGLWRYRMAKHQARDGV